MEKPDFSKIKLIVWDMDNTFWKGIISESAIETVDAHLELVRALTDCGIINSICSKNTFEVCERALKELGVWDLFVFPSIDWTGKGIRIKNLVHDMGLRAENVLFIDDDITNLAEAQHYSPKLMVAEPTIIPELISYIAEQEKKDLSHTRLQQYKVLESKQQEQKKYDSNEAFLYASNIRVELHHDCLAEVTRIHELILRSNQLNFTKVRSSSDELQELVNDEQTRCGYVTVKDNFGDYGIIGFYAMRDHRLVHFLFSCRTIGLGVEQYVYASLGFPDLKISGEVVGEVNNHEHPLWINQTHQEEKLSTEKDAGGVNSSSKILIKGPCDLSKSLNYIKDSERFHYEFTYVTDKGNVIESINHSVHVLGQFLYSDAEKALLNDECIFTDTAMMSGALTREAYDVVFLSTLIESNYGIYTRKGSNLKVAFGSYLSPLTDPANWKDYVEGGIYNGNNAFSYDYLKAFSENYTFNGKTQPADYIQFLEQLLERLPNHTVICLMLGVEIPCEKHMEYDFKERHLSHQHLNDAIRAFARNNERIQLIDLNDIVKNQEDFTNNINHYTSKVYYEISIRIQDVISKCTGIRTEGYSKVYVYVDIVLGVLKRAVKSFMRKDSVLFRIALQLFHKAGRGKRKSASS